MLYDTLTKFLNIVAIEKPTSSLVIEKYLIISFTLRV